jgi:iron complex transport system substrate-binding protein
MRALTVEEIGKFDAQFIIVHGGRDAAARLRANPAWKHIPAVAQGRVFGWPNFPYSWGSQPPSVNRVAGLIWLSAVASGRGADAVANDIRRFFKDFYQVDLTDAQFKTLVGS